MAEAVEAARAFSLAAAHERFTGVPFDADSPHFHNYLITGIGTRREEMVQIFYFTGRGLYLADDMTTTGHTSSSIIPLRLLTRRAFELDARRVALAHNHPSGVATPSRADVTASSHAMNVLRALDIRLVDHFVVGGGQVCSMRALNLL